MFRINREILKKIQEAVFGAEERNEHSYETLERNRKS